MLLYSGILILTGLALLLTGRSIVGGNTRLIHDYHQTHVTDPAAYGRAFGKAMYLCALGPLLGGLLGLLGDRTLWVLLSMGVLFAGLSLGIARILAVQKKYNGGLF